MKNFIITANDNMKRIDNFLMKLLPHLSRNEIFALLRNNKVKVNGKKTQHDYRLSFNDSIDIYLNDEYFETKINDLFKLTKNDLNIIFEDKNIILLNKPIGLITHEDNKEKIHTLLNKLKLYMLESKQWNPEIEQTFEPSLCNRLDRNTSGIVIAAKNIEALRNLNEIIKNNEVKKFYYSVVYNKIPKKEDTLYAYHQKDVHKNIVKIVDSPQVGYKKIITKYKIIKSTDKYSVLEVELLTGRTHQIRAHLSFLKHPIIGDNKYSNKYIDKDSRFKTQLLVSYKIIFKTTNDYFKYLNNKEFKLNKIWFLDKFL